MGDIFKKSFFGFVLSVVVSRWQEVVLLVGLLGGLMFVWFELVGLTEPSGEINNDLSVFVVAGCVAFGVIVFMLVCGFLRSVTLVGCEPLMPVVLLKVGRRLFFRIFHLEIILELLTILVFVLLVSLMESVVQIEKANKLMQLRIVWLCMFFSQICLIKFRLVVMGVALVQDYRVTDAFRCLGQYRLRNGGAMLLVFGVSAAVLSTVSYQLQSATLFGKNTLVYSVFNGVVIGVTVVLWGLCAVWFAGRFTREQTGR